MYSKADLDHIRELKQEDPFKGIRERTSRGEECKIKIIGRGEVAFYQQGNRALLMQVIAGQGMVIAYSIRRWDDKKKVTDEEVKVVRK